MGYSIYVKLKSQEEADRVWNWLNNNCRTWHEVNTGVVPIAQYSRLCKGNGYNGLSYVIDDPNTVGFDYGCLFGLERALIWGIIGLASHLTKGEIYYDDEPLEAEETPMDEEGFYAPSELTKEFIQLQSGDDPEAFSRKFEKVKEELRRLKSLW